MQFSSAKRLASHQECRYYLEYAFNTYSTRVAVKIIAIPIKLLELCSQNDTVARKIFQVQILNLPSNL